MKYKSLLVLAFLLFMPVAHSQTSLNPGEIIFTVTNLEAAQYSSFWCFDLDATPFIPDGVPYGLVAYDSIKWNPDGRGDGTCTGNPDPPGTGHGSGLLTTAIASAENLDVLENVSGVTLYVNDFKITNLVHINTVNPANPWDTPGEAGDYRTYSYGFGEIRVDNLSKIKFNPITLYVTVHYPSYIIPGILIGDGGITGYSTLTGEGQIVAAESDPAWVAAMDPHNTGYVQFEAASMSAVIQYCYGTYSGNLLIRPTPQILGPEADFVADPVTGEPPLQVTFTDNSIPGDTTIVDWVWDFNGDGTIDATGQGPHVFHFPDPGSYSPILTVTDANALPHTLQKTNWIHVTLPPQETPGYFHFDYAGVYLSGSYSAEGHLDPFTYPSEGVLGTVLQQGDTTAALCAGIEALSADSLNLAGLFFTNPNGPLAVGNYVVDPVGRTALIGFAVGADLANIPADPADLVADRIYISVSGMIILSQITDSMAVGSFYGVLVNRDNYADILTVSNGDFVVPTGAIRRGFLSGEYTFHYSGSALSGDFNVAGTVDEVAVPAVGASGYYYYDLVSSYAAFSGVEVVQADSINLAGVFLNQPGELFPGTYTVNPITRSALFAFALGTQVRNFGPNPSQVGAEKIYVSANGSITLTTVSAEQIQGTFQGTMLNIQNPMDMLVVSNGAFTLWTIPKLALAPAETGPGPQSITLQRNFPNPFNPATTITYELPSNIRVLVQIFDLRGSLVRVLENGNVRAGMHRVTWDGRNDNGYPVASGIYLVRLQAGEVVRVQKLTLLR